MIQLSPTAPKQPINIPSIPALYVNAREAFILSVDGEVSNVSHQKARQIIGDKPVLVCHTPYNCKRLGVDTLAAFDILELFAFVHPATFAVPTPVGIAKALGLPLPESAEDYPFSLMEAASALLSDIRKDPWKARADALKIAGVMGQNGRGWAWTPYIFSALGQIYDEKEVPFGRTDLNIWKSLPEWSEEAPPPPPSHYPVTGEEARDKLQSVLGHGAEAREEQKQYAGLMAKMYLPKDDENPTAVLAEAGTGVGKTLGYLAPASVWAEKNKGSVWVSTFTKNLQHRSACFIYSPLCFGCKLEI